MNVLHVQPVGDWIEHTEDDDCPCGPDTKFVERGVLIVHHSLDNREANELAEVED